MSTTTEGMLLDGKWRISAIGNAISAGALGILLIRPFFAQARTESIPIQAIERLVVYTNKNQHTYHLFQPRDSGLVEVYVFKAIGKGDVDLQNLLQSALPGSLRLEVQA